MPATAPKGHLRSKSSTTMAELKQYYEEFARILDERKKEMTERVAAERANLDEQVLTRPGDEADSSVIDTSADYFLSLANTHQHELMEIRDALIRLNRGVYGICESCDLPISVNRLKNLPYARLCVDCQSAIEGTRLRRRLQLFPKSG